MSILRVGSIFRYILLCMYVCIIIHMLGVVRSQGTDHERLAASARGTPYWMAPEVICQQECSHKSDMWSIGCTLIEMFQTKPPWYELSPLAAAFAIGQGTSDPKLPDHLSQHARDITMKCLNR